MSRLLNLFRTTMVRLSLVYLVCFAVIVTTLVYYVSDNTGELIISQVRVAAEDEVNELSSVYRSGGTFALVSEIRSRSRNPGANLYLLVDPLGGVIGGNVRSIDATFLERGGWSSVPFKYETYDNDRTDRRAIGQVFLLSGGLRLLIGRDIGDATRFNDIIRRALTYSLGSMALIGLLVWLWLGNRTLRRIDAVTTTTSRIVSGDLGERLPLSGSGDEFDRLSSALNELVARIETLDSGVRRVSDAIAHDLKTPLSRLRADAERIISSSRSDSTKAELKKITEEADGLLATFEALLLISKIHSGAKAARMELVDVCELLSDIYDLFEPVASEQGVTLVSEHPKKIETTGNRELLAQAVTNLLTNCLRHGGEGLSHISIGASLCSDSGTLSLVVSDDGVGILPSDLPKSRERFWRRGDSDEGSGLGLSVVDAIAEYHSGVLTLESNNPGLRATIELPCSPHPNKPKKSEE